MLARELGCRHGGYVKEGAIIAKYDEGSSGVIYSELMVSRHIQT